MASLSDLAGFGTAALFGAEPYARGVDQRQNWDAQKSRNRLLELSAENRPTEISNQNRLSELAIQKGEQGITLGDQKINAGAMAGEIDNARTFVAALGPDFEQLDPATQQQQWMAAREKLISMDPSNTDMPEQFESGAYRLARNIASLAGGREQTSFENKLINAGYTPGTPEYQEAARKLLYKPSGTTVNVGTGGGPADAFDKAFGDSGEGRRLAIQARALARKEGISATDAIERVALQKDVTSGERAADTYYQRMTDVSQDIEAMEDQGYNPSAPDAILSKMPGGNFLVGNDYQQYQAMANEWIRAKLRKESGAAIPPEEMRGEFQTYFFVPGDSPETIRRKRQLRTQAREAMAGERSRLDAVGGQGGNQTVNWDDL